MTAVVTGAGRGLGKTIALALARSGRNVVAADLDAESCRAAADEIRAAGVQALAAVCDVSRQEQVAEMVETAVQTFGTIDILVNNAAYATLKPFLRISEEDWDRTMAVNMKGTFLCSQAAAKHMIRCRRGRIINIASISSGGAGVSFPLMAHYTASKGGIKALTEAMAVELAPFGINVNCVCPGAIDTGAVTGGIASRSLARIPKGRLARPEEVASLVLYLASEEAEYITGSSMVVDGGWLSA